jgi:transcriptional regulator with XRE-family HTH domain
MRSEHHPGQRARRRQCRTHDQHGPRELRHQAGLTVEDVAGHLLCSATKVSRMETGHRGASLRDVRDLCDLYGVTDPARRERMMTLARQSRQRSWWQEHDHLLPQYSTFIGLEAAAVSIKDYESGIVPGLVQTEDYARAMIRGTMLPKLSPEAIEERVEARMTRQALLSGDDPPRLWVVLDEAVLHRRVGGPAIMRAQLERLVHDSDRPNITVQVLSYDVGAHPGLDSTFIILDFKEPALSSAVYVEGLVGQLYLERETDIDRYSHAFDQLRAMALSPAASIDLVAKISRDLDVYH